MMATEPTGDDLADVSVSSKLQPDNQVHDHREDVPTENGHPALSENESFNRPAQISEDHSNSAEASLSGGSDAEASRPGRQAEVDKGHGRSSSSAKKTATFKAVSVNKTFLASKSSPGGSAAKAVERPIQNSSTPPPGSSSLSSSRPRLVAKTGSSARDSSPRFSAVANGAKAAAAPDPSAVWNKNRPPEPKKFTDEELKKYGIHMASRLNENDAQGQNKWADIDDDDEDWAPEAITWGDGTKTTLPHTDEPSGPVQESGSSPTDVKTQVRPKSPAPPTPSRSPLVRLGGLATGRGLILKPASQEKPALVAKPAAPIAPAKSPWATLPPIDRASPGLVEIASPAYAQARASAVTKSANSNQPKEIAADDFSRSSWRESTSHGNRELFNSQSGRYEPVPDRRGSFKSEAHVKQPPALLQRPPQTDQVTEMHGLPLAARMAQDGIPTRRRGSSSVSTGSGPHHHRNLKVNDPVLPPDMTGASRPTDENTNDNVASPRRSSFSNPMPATEQINQSQAAKSSHVGTSATPHAADAATVDRASPQDLNDEGIDDQVQYQKKLMRERIELAKKRRQEEEAREESAKKERIQKKLESLGPPPGKKIDKKEMSPRVEHSKPTRIQQREKPTSDDQHGQSMEGLPASGGQPTSSTADSQPSGSPGSSKPHSSAPTMIASSPSTLRRLSQGHESKRSDPWGGSGPRPEKFSWGSTAPPPSRNVWGSPDNDRGLGNGTFNPDLGRIGSSPNSATQSSHGPLPIAPPSNSTRTPAHPPSQAPHMSAANSQSSIYGPPGSDLASKWVASVAENDQKLSAARLTERMSREQHLRERGLTMEDAQPVIKDTWRPIHVPADGTRHRVGPVEVQSHQPAPYWKSSKDGPARAVTEDAGLSASTGVIGSSAATQSRSSRFFPARDFRQEPFAGSGLSRPLSPIPPPPTMEGHPVYEGDMMRPHVSLPKPQPIVKLPPALTSQHSNQTRPVNAWVSRLVAKDNQREPLHHGAPAGGEGIWQARFHKLLHGDKSPQFQDSGIDASSRGALDHHSHGTSANVVLPAATSTQLGLSSRSFIVTKPMAEECFEEQEMGSLPRIRLPHKAPEAAWHPAVAQAKALPKRSLVHATSAEPFQILSENHGGPSVNIFFPGMKEPRAVPLPHSSRRGLRSSHGQRTATGRVLGSGSRGAKNEPFVSHHGESSAARSGRGSRGYRSRAASNWTRQSSSQSQNHPRSTP